MGLGSLKRLGPYLFRLYDLGWLSKDSRLTCPLNWGHFLGMDRLLGKQVAALRAIAATPGGLRITAYPSAMPLLVQMGLVEERAASRIAHRDGRAWFLTVEGRETVRAYGVDEA